MLTENKNNRYKELIDGLEEEKIIQLMNSLGAHHYNDTPKALIFPTICHNTNEDEASMKLYYYKNEKFFYCYTEDGGMSIFSFLKHYYEARGIDYDWYSDIYRVIENCSLVQSIEGFTSPIYESLSIRYQRTEDIILPEINPGILDIFTKFYPPEWLEDGITKDAMDKFNISYSISQNKIIIPHYDVNQRLVGIRGRALDPWEIENVGKYMPVKIEGKWYAHGLSFNLYGLNWTIENIKKYKTVFIFESEKAVMQMENFQMPNCAVAVCGSNFNKHQLHILLDNCYPNEIVICFDKEELPGEDKYFNKLYSICHKYNSYCNFSFIYDREGLTEMKDSPTDKGEKIFKELLSRRVFVS